jgi:hypothetical protein
VGVEWVYPVGRDPSTRVGLFLETVVDGRACRSRADFDAIGLCSRYHSSLAVGFNWQLDNVQVDARFFLADDEAVSARIMVRNAAVERRRLTLIVGGRADAGELLTEHEARVTETPCAHVVLGGRNGELELGPGEERQFSAVLARAADADAAIQRGRAAASIAETTYTWLIEEDARFSASCPTLSGDWPAHWAEGLHHDFQTTRLLVQPPGGIFADVWPSWMAAWPRVVLAEGTLDMLRLAYADPPLAQRAVLSLLRDAPDPNIPCVFQGGEYNMVAADGSRCGTSPAWCLPFLSLELLYLRTLDREWLGQAYPYASAYLEWWLEHRVDAQGWLVYKCTWESGEDGNPRLDPTGSGDADISGHVRPVELQATMSHAAGVMAFFASELQQPGERWQRIATDYRERTRRLFDPDTGRFRDWLIAEQRLQDACPERPYWGIDACRYSAQSLTPLLIGEPLDADEVWRHACAPWTLWPSWTWSLVESAAASRMYERVGDLVFETIDRVYRMTTRRELGSLPRPLPGSSPEFWPTDWRTYGGSDAYGWGASTANLLIRHLFGFKESRETDGWVAELTPALPRAMLRPGGRYGLRQLNYRGLVFDMWYRVPRGDLDLEVELDLRGAVQECTVHELDDVGVRSEPVYTSGGHASSSHRFAVQPGRKYRLQLRF